MNGYQNVPGSDALYRDLNPTASDLIKALAALPPETTITVGSNDWDGGKTEPDGVWYYPAAREAFIA